MWVLKMDDSSKFCGKPHNCMEAKSGSELYPEVTAKHLGRCVSEQDNGNNRLDGDKDDGDGMTVAGMMKDDGSNERW